VLNENQSKFSFDVSYAIPLGEASPFISIDRWGSCTSLLASLAPAAFFFALRFRVGRTSLTISSCPSLLKAVLGTATAMQLAPHLRQNLAEAAISVPQEEQNRSNPAKPSDLRADPQNMQNLSFSEILRLQWKHGFRFVTSAAELCLFPASSTFRAADVTSLDTALIWSDKSFCPADWDWTS
jgi:hypothetical protein